MTPVEFGLTIVLGVLTGVMSSVFGVGGAVISTPGIRALGATALEGVGSTLPAILPSAITGTIRYHRERLVRWSVVRWVVPAGVVMAVLGALASTSITGKGHVQMIMTAGLVGYTAFSVYRRPRERNVAETDERDRSEHAGWRAATVGAVAGTLSGFLGIGGGLFMLPAFKGWLKLPIKDTIGTSLACVGMLAIPGTVTHALRGNVNWAFALPLCIGVIPGAQLGSKWAVAANDRTLRLAIAYGLGLISIVYGLAELIALT